MKKLVHIQFHRHSKLYLVCVEDSDCITDFAMTSGIDVPDDKSDFEGLFAKEGNLFYIIFHKNTSYGDLAHECAHFLNTIYLAIGQELDSDNDEMYCHQLGFFTDECVKFQNKYNETI